MCLAFPGRGIVPSPQGTWLEGMTGNVARKLGPEGGEAWVQADIVLPRNNEIP